MNNKTNILLLEVFLWIRAILEFVPAAREFSPMLVNVISVVIVYICLFVFAGVNVVAKTIIRFFPIYVIMLADALWGYKTVSVFSFLYGLAQWMVWPIALYYLVSNQKTSAINRLFYVSIALLLFTSITTYYGNLLYPGASRALAAIWSDDVETAHFYQRLNIGGFDFIYLLVLMIPLWVYCIRALPFKHNKVRIILLILSLLVSLVTIISSEYTTALVFSFVSLLLFILPRFFTKRQLFIFITFLVVFLAVGRTLTSVIITRIVDRTESEIVSERLLGISDFLLGGAVEGDAGTRKELMQKSWDSFMQNPLTGSSQVGGHSFILDAMGHFGLLGVLLVLVVFLFLYKLCVKPYKWTMFYGYCFFAFICQIGLALVNTQIIFQAFLIMAPLIAFLFNPKQKKMFFN